MKSSSRRSAFECLEARVCLHGDGHESQADLAFISTHHGNVPNLAHAQFAEGRTIHAIAEDGELSAILVDHAVAENDILILQGHVTYDLQPAAAFSVHTLAVDAGGALDFRTDIETRLAVTNLIIFEGGTVTVGTEAGPIGTGVSSEIVIADSPINVNVDPEQFGHGILVFGTLQMHGAPLTNTIAKLAQDAHAGDSTIHLQQAMTDWHPGDILFLPDTRQATSSDVDASGRMRVGQWEEVTVAGISQDGRTITTSAAIAYDHVGARNPVTGQQEDFDHDGYFDLMPHAANETRNVVVQSANPIGTRGHFVAFNRSEVDLRYVQFDELGRTTVSPIDSTTLDASGNVTHIGTNQIGRYALHFHHVQGVANPASGYTVQVVGCTVTDTKRWGIVLHDTSWSNVSQNVVLRADGAGIVTEDGSDAFNTISRNFVGVSTGDGNTQDSISFLPGVVGFHGYGLWLSGVQDSVIEGNIMVNHAVAGMNINFQAGSGGPLVSVPRFPGADVTVATDAVPYYTGAQMPRSIANNEFYGAMTFGFESWTVTGGPTNLTYATDARVLSEPFLISDSRAWHLHGAVSRGGYAGNHSIDGLVARNQFNATVLADYQRNQSVYAAVGVRVSRTNSVLRNFDIQGFSVGVLTAQFGDFQNVSKALFVDNGRLVNYIDALVSDVTLSDRDEIIFNDVIFDALPGYPLISFMWGDTPENRLRGASQNSFHLRSTFGELYIQNYNRVPQQDYKLYREGQNPFYVHRLSDGDFTAQSLWDYRRFAVRGELSPCLDAACSNGVHSHPEILADVFAAGDSLASINVGPVDGTYYAGYRSTFPYFTARYTLRDSNGDRYNVTRQLPVSPGLNTAVLTETATDQGELSQPVTIYVDGDAPVAALEVTDITTTQARLHVTANEPVVLQVTAPAVLGTYVYSLEGDLRLTNLVPNTTYTVTMRVTDRSGNAAVPVATFTTASVDVPQLVIESPLPNATVDAPVSVVYHVTGDTSNVRRISWRLGTLSANETVLDGQHQFPVVPSGTYTLSASIVDAAGVVIPASQISFPLAVLNTDTARPVIANILTTDVDADSVRISWTTDEPATTRLTVDGRTVVNNTSLTTDHVATVDNLVRGQRMAANVQSADSAANLTERFIYFAAGASEPALQPPVISDVHIVATASNAVLTWRTDRPADTRIDLGSYPAVRTLIRSQGLSVSHRVDVVGLVPDTAYHLNVSSSTITGFASENIHIFTPAAPGVIDLSELVAISNFGGDIRGNTANLIRQRLVPAAADAAIRTVTVPHVTQRALRSSRSRSVMDRAITASSLPTTGLRGQAAWPLTSRGRR